MYYAYMHIVCMYVCMYVYTCESAFGFFCGLIIVGMRMSVCLHMCVSVRVCVRACVCNIRDQRLAAVIYSSLDPQAVKLSKEEREREVKM